MKKKDERQLKWMKENEEVRKWLSELERRSLDTARSRRYFLYHYCKWLYKEKKIPTTRQLLNHYKISKKSGEEYQHIDWLKEYIFGEGRTKSFSWREGCLSSIREFYRSNRLPLPDEKIHLTIREVDANHLREKEALETMTLDDFRKLIAPAKIREKAALLTMVQSGMGVGEFCNQFNVCTCTKQMVKKHGHTCVPANVTKQLKENKNPIKIFPLIAFKQRNLNDKHVVYFSYIGGDAIDTLKQYLVFRKQLVEKSINSLKKLEERESKGLYLRKRDKKTILNLRSKLDVITPELREGEPIFITNTLAPIHDYNIQHAVKILKRQTGLSDRDFGPHGCRDLFKTTCDHAGVKDNISEYFIRHRLDAYGYNQLDKLHPEDFEAEYAKAIPYLNIISRTEKTKETMTQVDELRKQVEELQGFREKVVNGLLDNLRVLDDLTEEDRKIYLQHWIEALRKTKD